MKPLLLVATILLGTFCANAQFQDSIKAQMIADWQRAKTYTGEYLDVMPAAKFSFRAQDSVRTFAQQMLHLAQGTVGLMAAGTGKKVPDAINRPDLEKTASAASKDSVKYFVNLSYDFAIEAVRAFDMAKAFERESRGALGAPKLGWMQKAFEHQTHHRGQTTIYLRLAGIKPPAEKLF